MLESRQHERVLRRTLSHCPRKQIAASKHRNLFEPHGLTGNSFGYLVAPECVAVFVAERVAAKQGKGRRTSGAAPGARVLLQSYEGFTLCGHRKRERRAWERPALKAAFSMLPIHPGKFRHRLRALAEGMPELANTALDRPGLGVRLLAKTVPEGPAPRLARPTAEYIPSRCSVIDVFGGRAHTPRLLPFRWNTRNTEAAQNTLGRVFCRQRARPPVAKMRCWEAQRSRRDAGMRVTPRRQNRLPVSLGNAKHGGQAETRCFAGKRKTAAVSLGSVKQRGGRPEHPFCWESQNTEGAQNRVAGNRNAAALG